jgi:hypothetical protein
MFLCFNCGSCYVVLASRACCKKILVNFFEVYWICFEVIGHGQHQLLSL